MSEANSLAPRVLKALNTTGESESEFHSRYCGRALTAAAVVGPSKPNNL